MELKGAIVKFNHSSSSRVNSLKSNLLSLSHKERNELCVAFFSVLSSLIYPDHLTKHKKLTQQTYRGEKEKKISSRLEKTTKHCK